MSTPSAKRRQKHSHSDAEPPRDAPAAAVPMAGGRARALRDSELAPGVSLSGNLKLSVYEAAAHGTAAALAPLLRQFVARGKTLASLGGRNRTTMLHEAAYADNAETAAYLLARGAPRDARDKAKATPLQMAAFAGASRCVALLLERGADACTADAQGTTPLHAAAIAGHQGNVRALVKHKADIHARDEFKATPLHYAALHGQFEVVSYLLKKGADPDAADEEGLTALHMALEDGHDRVVDALLSAGASPNALTVAGQTPLHHAAERNRLACVRALLAQGAKVDAIDAAGSTPLHLAAFHGHLEMLGVLLAAGARVDADQASAESASASKSKSRGQGQGASAAAAAEHSSRADDDDLAVPVSARSRTEDEHSSEDLVSVYDTPLHHAAHQGQTECVRALLAAGADVDAVDAAGASALHKAAFNQHLECVRVLLDANAAVGAADAEGSTALHRAAHAGDAHCVSLLLERGADVGAADASQGTPLHNAAYAGHREALLALLAAKADVNASDEAGNSPLHLAMHQSQRDCGKVLLARGANSSLRNKKGMIPLHYAVNDTRCLKLLLDVGCEPDARDDRGRAPLFYAVRGGCEDSVRLLMRAGADLRATDKKGKSPLDIASKQTKRWLQRLLRERDDAARTETVRRYRKAVPHFNEHPRKGIAWAIENGVLPNAEPDTIAEFLHDADDLNKVQVGQYIADKAEEAAPIRRAYMRRMDFIGMHVAEALRDVLTRFRLPGEAQQIDRVMEGFAARYHECNPKTFSHEDTGYILSVAIIMLNTDAHNDNIKEDKKMSKEEFINNCRGIDQGKDLPREYLEELYDDVRSNEIKMDTRDSYTAATKKGILTKQGGRIKTWKKRWFVVSDGCLYYFKDSSAKEPLGIIPLENVDVRLSKKKKWCFELWQTDNQTMKAAKIASDGSIQRGHHDSYALAAASQEEMREWVDAIERCVCQNPFQRLIDRRLASGALAGVDSHEAAAAHEASTTGPLAARRPDASTNAAASVLASLQIDYGDAYKHIGMCRMAAKSESYLHKKFGPETVVVRRRRLSAYLAIDRDAKRQYIVVCPEDATLQRRLHGAWGADNDSLHSEDEDEEGTAEEKEKNEEEKEAEEGEGEQRNGSKRGTDQYNNDGSAGVGDLSADRIHERAMKLLRIEESVEDLYDAIAPALDKTLFITVIAYSVACWSATLLALRLKNSGCRLRMVQTFGSPRFVRPKEVVQYGGLPIMRVRVVDDPVPLAVLPGMRHVGLPVVLLKGQYYSQLATPMGDAEELNALLPGSRPLLDAQHHLDEYAENIRTKRSSSIVVSYRSPDRLKYSI